ncbi:MAG: hypothetical protein KKD29_02460 [Candidatus Omnitrophica bacterium]|nr:hypothetical protein [Candidatus Omnitrophota bacterium]MBU4487896.1 hypothetical protein [Candidatus Omnitrophota bacterium]MCG2705515.1 hypothetical protein [Candidatus Omnitrophota bacterium]
MKKALIVIVVMLVGLAVTMTSYCAVQPPKKDMKTLNGEIVTKDTVAQTIEVRWLRDPVGRGYDQTTFLVSEEAKITDGIEGIGFEELDMGDKVIIVYYEDPFGELVATRITVKVE